jgi:hypothetical protein
LDLLPIWKPVGRGRLRSDHGELAVTGRSHTLSGYTIQEMLVSFKIAASSIGTLEGEGPHRILEYDPFTIPLAWSLGFDAVVAYRFAFIALDPSPATS